MGEEYMRREDIIRAVTSKSSEGICMGHTFSPEGVEELSRNLEGIKNHIEPEPDYDASKESDAK